MAVRLPPNGGGELSLSDSLENLLQARLEAVLGERERTASSEFILQKEKYTVGIFGEKRKLADRCLKPSPPCDVSD
jgi:hypothetical protein